MTRLVNLKPDPGPVIVRVPVGDIEVAFTCDPVGNGDMEVYSARAARVVDEIERGLMLADDFGFIDRAIDMTDPDEREGLKRQIMIEELAVDKIRKWSGIGQPGEDGEMVPAELTEPAVRAVMRLPSIGQAFLGRLMKNQTDRILAKNGSGPSAGGNTPAAAGRNTAKGAQS